MEILFSKFCKHGTCMVAKLIVGVEMNLIFSLLNDEIDDREKEGSDENMKR